MRADTCLVDSESEQHLDAARKLRAEGRQSDRRHRAGELEGLDELALHPEADGLYEPVSPVGTRGDGKDALMSVYLR
jgi:hypothetical protein